MLTHGLGAAVIGLLAGSALGILATRLIASLLYEVHPSDPVLFGRARREPTVRDAHEVLLALVTGRPVPWASRPAVGCFIDDLR